MKVLAGAVAAVAVVGVAVHLAGTVWAAPFGALLCVLALLGEGAGGRFGSASALSPSGPDNPGDATGPLT